jgi:long-chain acyl-CoA synthetase
MTGQEIPAGVPLDPAATLWDTFTRTAAARPDRTAVEAPEGLLTFEQVAQAAHDLAETLRGLGVEPGSVVHLALANGPAFLPAVLALRSLDVTVGLVSSRYRDAELRAVTARVRPDAFLTSAQLAGVLGRAIEVTGAIPVGIGPGEPELRLVVPGPGATGQPLPESARDLAVVKFTSGSTGAPKGIGLTEANLAAEARNLVATLGITDTDRILAPVPLSHSYGFDLGLLPVVAAGACTVVRRSFIPREILGELARAQTSVFLGVPSMYRILAETPPAAVPDLSHVRYLLSCTAPLLPSLVEQCRERLGVPVCQHYGSSETGAAANHRPPDVARLPASIGVALDGVEIRVVDDQGGALPVGQEGEIVIRSRAVARGYVTPESPTAAEAFRTGRDGITEYRTGDLGTIDAEGFVFWQGRRDQVINVGGLKVYPSEVVQVLERCPGVSAARAIAARTPGGEEVVHAIVTLSQSNREQDILDFCRQHLADYKVPRRIEIVDSIAAPEAEKMRNLSGDIS